MPRVTRLIDSKLHRKWSPEQVSGWLRESEASSISHDSIYQHIWKDKKSGGQLYHHLRRQEKFYQPRSKSQAGRGHIRNRVSIDERSAIVDEKPRVGVWKLTWLLTRVAVRASYDCDACNELCGVKAGKW
jgi:IS30 family transposase